jgi:hypothetical protein
MAGSATAENFEGEAEADQSLHPRRCEFTTLIELADRVRRLAPRHGDPEAFHVEKSEIEHALRRLARES